VRLALTVAVGCATVMVVIVILSARAGIGSASGAPPAKSDGFYGAPMPQSFPAVNFALRNLAGSGHQTVRLSDFAGQVVAAAFVYSTCASTCPLVVEELKNALDQLPRAIPALAITVDPKQDTAANVKTFLVKEQVYGQIDYLVGSRKVMTPIWKKFGVQPQLAVNSSKSDHSVLLLLFDRAGRARVAYSDVTEMDPGYIDADIYTLQHEPLPQPLPKRVSI
jgi:cytochrome oxidase Cu insertion factor (SCO1/SenC/PrrC family)